MRKELLLEILGILDRQDFLRLKNLAQLDLWKTNKQDQQFLSKLADNPHQYERLYELEKANSSSSFKERKANIVKLIEDYILLLENRKEASNVNCNLRLLNFYNLHRLESNYRNRLNKVQNAINNQPSDKDTSLALFRYNEIKATNSRVHREPMKELEEMSKHLLSFFIENSLRLTSEAATQKEIINYEYDINELFQLIGFKSSTLVKEIYENIYHLHIDAEAKERYHYLKNIIIDRESEISEELLNTIHVHLMNYSVKNMNKGNPKYASEYLFFIESLNKRNLLLERNRLDYGRYRNVIISYLIVSPKNFARVDGFIKNYKNILNVPSNTYLSIVKINSLYVSSFKKEYDKAHQELITLGDSDLDLHHKIMFKKLDLRLMIMLANKTSTLEKKITNFNTFLNRQGQLKNSKKLKVTLGFTKCMYKMLNNKLTHEDIQETELALTDKIWFLTKILERSQTSL